MQKKIYGLLSQASGYISGEEISEKLGISRQAVWKNINKLKEQGFVIESVTNRGYRLIKTPDNLCKLALDGYLQTDSLGKNAIILDSSPSTNDSLKALASQGAQEGTVIAAREQTKGKGRLGRSWVCKKDESLTFSLLLRPKAAPAQVSAVTPLTGLAVCRAVRDYYGIDCKIKWPNDIIVNNKKLVGILAEMGAEFDAVEYIVLGIGINTDQEEFPKEIADKATSIFIETGKHTDKNRFLAVLLKYLEEEFMSNGECRLSLEGDKLELYKELCATLGRKISFFRGSEKISAFSRDIDSKGELLAEDEKGRIFTVNSGEVTVQGIY